MTLDDMTWEERFCVAWEALCAMEARAEIAEARLLRASGDLRIDPEVAAQAEIEIHQDRPKSRIVLTGY